MSDDQRLADIEALAKIAARLAGRDPDEHVRLNLGGVVAFDDVMWRYPDFMTRAETAYAALNTVSLTRPGSLDWYEHSSTAANINRPISEMRWRDG